MIISSFRLVRNTFYERLDMDKLKKNNGKNKKLIYITLSVIVVFFASIIAFKIYNSQPKHVEDESFVQKDSNINKNNEVSVKSLLKKYPVEVKGYNGYGVLSFYKSIDTSRKEDIQVFNVDGDFSPLKNGDRVTLRVSESYVDELKSDGLKLDKEKIEIKVSGLKDISEIKNLDALIKENDNVAEYNNESNSYNKYNIERQSDFIKYIPYPDDGSRDQISFVSVYKVTSVSSSETKTEYYFYGNIADIKKNGNLDLETADAVVSLGRMDLETILADLKERDYKEIKLKK